jgi:hypothetical protein
VWHLTFSNIKVFDPSGNEKKGKRILNISASDRGKGCVAVDCSIFL